MRETLYKSRGEQNMTGFSSKDGAGTCNKLTARGKTETFTTAISLAEMKRLARAWGIDSFHAYNSSGRELSGSDFPYNGDVELREYSAPKTE
jgi:hypothetical protein